MSDKNEPYDPDFSIQVGRDRTCQCPLCGRLHRFLANNPPAAISETVTLSRDQHDALMAAKKALATLFDTDKQFTVRACFDALAACRAAGVIEDKT